MSTDPSPDFPELVQRTTEVWDHIAAWWDDRIGDGNDFQDLLIEPATERLLALRPGEQMLDVACGGGRFARRMATQGVSVVAIDHSERFIQRARQRTTENADRIAYLTMNAADAQALLSLGEGRFDAAVCTMALMDMAAIEPLFSALPRLLKPKGRFVFSVMHPVFNSPKALKVAQEMERDGKVSTIFGVTVHDYATPSTHRGEGILGQPELQHYFHRSISMLFNACFKHGFVLDRMEEPTFPEALESPARSNRPLGSRPLNWVNFPAIPPILVARMRLP